MNDINVDIQKKTDNKDKYRTLFDENHNLKSLKSIGAIIKAENPNQILTDNSLYNAVRRKWSFIRKINNEKL